MLPQRPAPGKIGQLLTLLFLLLACPPGGAQYKTLGPGSCGLGQSNCHAQENEWWKNDAHKVTVDAFFDDPAAYEKIARLAGVNPAEMLKGNQSCMSCHGTVISGRESREVEEGVSCESCHGPGSGYKDPHSEGDPKLGRNRPGYVKALRRGLVELANLEQRAATCVRCHYITDQKLLAAGHPDGARFNYISGLKKVARHWKRQPDQTELNKAPFERAMAGKGPVLAVAAVTAAPATAPPAPPPPAAKTGMVQAENPPATAMSPARMTAAAGRAMPAAAPMAALPVAPAETTRVRLPLTLPPFPAVSDTASIGEILLLVKKRLEMLYQRTGQ
ncbi:MAG: multiheme c-type cytochrome [candidate division KSB1 bacterium]|nr:multiheme c-type cytochrome [candidate division KSB1 bacterium]MDZ7286561.1 multiheme c-type cytochrome [candidate division KSB1 bacterium]MDZ7299275.1 multiheme c-type cytochrome [candidate division KSB1 bacterium]MDZ7306065.1 multiheme c-type cytochrome [candidate division KSB1 bacterium]MDZ7350139.1 multiheme c-type cytochrome [candidate division KSB1 bacterium]